MRFWKTTIILSLLIVLVMAQLSPAMPGFARKYKMSCTTCHAPFPRLKAYGDEFAGNAFVLKDQDAPRYFADTGDQNLNLIRDINFGFRMEGWMNYRTVTDKDLDLSTPYLLKMISGGSLGKNLAYYFYFFMDERGEVAGIEDAYLMFNDIAFGDLDIYLGQFQVSDPLMKRELRLTYEDYMIYKTRVGLSRANLAYDKGLMLTYGMDTGTSIILEVVNGNGLTEVDQNRTFDDDKYKNYAARVSQDIGEHLRIGGFGYLGKEDFPVTGTTYNGTNDITYVGGDATVAFGPIELNAQYMMRTDSDPDFFGDENDTETTGGILELIFSPNGDQSKWYAAALYNWIESDYDDDPVFPTSVGNAYNKLAYSSATGHFTYMLKTNIRIGAEVSYDLENEETRAGVGFILGF